MWVVCAELRSLYKDELTEADEPLMASTLGQRLTGLLSRDFGATPRT
jgi:hypothetical protein